MRCRRGRRTSTCWVRGARADAVNNAGLAAGTARVGEIDGADLDAMLDTNVRGLIRVTQLFVPRFRARGRGHIINVGSVAGVEAYPGGSVVRGARAHAVLCDQVCRARVYVGADEGGVRHTGTSPRA